MGFLDRLTDVVAGAVSPGEMVKAEAILAKVKTQLARSRRYPEEREVPKEFTNWVLDQVDETWPRGQFDDEYVPWTDYDDAGSPMYRETNEGGGYYLRIVDLSSDIDAAIQRTMRRVERNLDAHHPHPGDNVCSRHESAELPCPGCMMDALSVLQSMHDSQLQRYFDEQIQRRIVDAGHITDLIRFNTK